MTTHQFVDAAPLIGAKVTKDGYLAASVRCARTGIQDYAGAELGMPERERIRVYRPESEVFSTDSLASYAHRPVTDDHPKDLVDAENWKEHAVGSVGDEVRRDGDFVRVPMLLMDAKAIRQVQGGKRELSMGYVMDLDFTPGVTPEGEAFDASMRNLRMNHLAIVQRGRAGSEVRVGDADEHWGARPIHAVDDGNHEERTMTTKTVAVDGLDIETNDIGAQAIEKLKSERQAARDAAATDRATHDTEMQARQAAHDAALSDLQGQLATKDAEIAELRAQVLDAAALDAKVAERAALVTKAQTFAKDADFTGKSDSEIKAIAVDAVHGEGFTADKAAAYVDVAFDLLKAPVATDTVRTALASRTTADAASDDNGQSAYQKRIADAWKGTGRAA